MKKNKMEKKFEPILVYSLVLIPCIITTTIIASYWGLFASLGLEWRGRIFPWWTDGGNWLKHSNAILGAITEEKNLLQPMWEEGLFQYPPLFFFIVAAVESLTKADALLSIKLAALACYFIFPIAMFILSRKIFQSSFAGIAATWLTAFFPLFLEFVGWGGYPNILGFAVLAVAFYYIINYVEARTVKQGLFATIFIFAVVITHHLTSLVLLGTLTLLTVFSIVPKRPERRQVATMLFVALSVFLAYRFLSAWPLEYDFFNEAAYYRLRVFVNLDWVFKSPLLSISFLVALIFCVPIIVDKIKVEDFRLRFFTAWVLTPIIGTQGYLLKVALDYNRIFFFVFQPLVLLVSVCASPINMKEIANIVQKYAQSPWTFLKSLKSEQAVQIASLFITILLVTSNTLQGLDAVRNINSWYSSEDLYGDVEKFKAVNWLRVNSTPADVIVAEEPVGRWIEGVSQRKVLLHIDPEYLFMNGELEREYAARVLLTSQYSMKSQDVWICEQAPYGFLSPIIAFKYLGEYVNSLILNTHDSYVMLEEDGRRETISLDTPATATKVAWSLRSGKSSSLLINRTLTNVEIFEKLSLDTSQTVIFEFNITTLNNVRTAETVLSFNFTSQVPIPQGEGLRVYNDKPLAFGVKTDMGTFSFEASNATNCKVEAPNLFTSKNFSLTFNKLYFRLKVRLLEMGNSLSDIETYAWDELAQTYIKDEVTGEPSIMYLILPNVPSTSGTLLEYSHLLNPDFQEAYNLTVVLRNVNVIILKYAGKPD